jgi:enoyl-CoA hydratase/carnithine racemase
MKYELVELTFDEHFATVTLNNPAKRNALSMPMMRELTAALSEAGESSVRGVFLAANGHVFSAGHSFADMAGQDLKEVRKVLKTCTRLMETIQAIPQPVLAKIHALATAAGCQLVATCDLAVAVETAGFATPGGKGGWFCHTPMVAVSRNIGRKRAMEMLLTGDVIDARTAYEWGLINRCVPADKLDEEAYKLLDAATRGSRLSKELGKQAYYAQIDLDQPKAYTYAIEMMASSSQLPDAQEGMKAFLEKRHPKFEQ